jgi:hypothetical protein
MDCVEAKLRIEPYVTGKLSPGEKGAFESHLEACAECRLDAELTRASHSEPSAPAASSGPPDPPPSPPSNTNWTIDSIFGAPKKPGGYPGEADGSAPPAPEAIEPSPSRAEAAPAPEPTAEPAPADFAVPPAFTVTSTQEDSFENVLAGDPVPPQEPEPEPHSEVELPAMLDDPPPRRSKKAGREVSADEDESSDGAAWDFEPADQKDGALPPEGSLFFAEEALGRSGKKGKKGKGSFAKAALWILGGIVGLGLLGVSVWIALAVRGGSSSDLAAHSVTHETPPPTTSTPPPVPGVEPQVGATPITTAGRGAAETPNKEASETSPSSEATAEAPVRKTVEEPPPSGSTPKTTVPPKSGIAGAPKKTAQTLAAERNARELASLPTPWRNPLPRPVRPRPTPVDEGDDDAPPAMKPVAASVKPIASTAPKPVETPKPSASIDSSAMAAIQRTLAPPTDAASPQNASTEAAPPDASTRPLDRLHTATLEAEQKADLETLRKLRETWRGQARTNVGPDRARSKRELADCLWAIQTLTSRTADQKAALAAYRDYILNAPAGGADARTVARMRQLEDALTESH